ncbi:MAG: type VI secretion system contractile sheath large subunit [Gammaproteobacteria bacterium]
MSTVIDAPLRYKTVLDSLNIKAENLPVATFSDYNALADKTEQERLSASLEVFFNLLEQDKINFKNIDKNSIDFLISKIDDMLGQQLDTILHHPAFQKVESLWKSVHFLVDRTDFNSNIEVDLLDVSKEDLMEDFEDALDITQSGLYKQVYVNEYDTPGGKPYSVILSDYEFSNKNYDINLLKDLARVASSAHCPFLANVGPQFFGKNNMDEVSRIQDLKEYFERPEYIRWNKFRETEDARFIGLVMPKFLLRLPYGENNPIRGFDYQEQFSTEQEGNYLWGAASFAFTSNLVRSFKKHGWTVGIRGPEAGGRVEDLLVHHYLSPRGLESKIPVEMLIPETRELELAELGLIPFSYYKNSDYACFFSANSVHKSSLFDDPDLTANSRINARLPYIFLASRIGHYLKVLQRENLGGIKDRSVLEQELNTWLNNLVTAMPNPGTELIAKRPLRHGQVKVSDIEDNPGNYKVEFYIVPHFQVEGMDIKLSLMSKLPA